MAFSLRPPPPPDFIEVLYVDGIRRAAYSRALPDVTADAQLDEDLPPTLPAPPTWPADALDDEAMPTQPGCSLAASGYHEKKAT